MHSINLQGHETKGVQTRRVTSFPSQMLCYTGARADRTYGTIDALISQFLPRFFFFAFPVFMQPCDYDYCKWL